MSVNISDVDLLSVCNQVCVCVCVCACLKGGKAQIIGPEEEDEEDDGYAFNEVIRTSAAHPSDSYPTTSSFPQFVII